MFAVQEVEVLVCVLRLHGHNSESATGNGLSRVVFAAEPLAGGGYSGEAARRSSEHNIAQYAHSGSQRWRRTFARPIRLAFDSARPRTSICMLLLLRRSRRPSERGGYLQSTARMPRS
jgi:hypothetical protein